MNRPGDGKTTSGSYWQQSHSINVITQASGASLMEGLARLPQELI